MYATLYFIRTTSSFTWSTVAIEDVKTQFIHYIIIHIEYNRWDNTHY